jgi:serine protease Do
MKCPKCGQVRVGSGACPNCGPLGTERGPAAPAVAMGALLAVLASLYLSMVLLHPNSRAEGSRADSGRSESVRLACAATVSIKSPWCVGSGFFVDRAGRVVTNRHVVELDAEVMEKLSSEREECRRYLWAADSGYSNSDPGQKVKARERVAEIDSILQLYGAEKRPPKITVITDSGKECEAILMRTSAAHDLALLSTTILPAPFLRMGDTEELKIGDPVYAIGCPLGLRQTVTAGILSGRVSIEGEGYLQTDAPINPGNSGGPLISLSGNAVGVNTLSARGGQGLGFAIPIETVRAEFQLKDMPSEK